MMRMEYWHQMSNYSGVPMADYGGDGATNFSEYLGDYEYEDEFYAYDDFLEPCETVNNHKLEQVVRPFVHTAICIAGLLGNLLVILIYGFYKRAKSMTDVYLLNLAFSDVLLAVALPVFIYNEQYNWAMGTWACKLLRGIYSINLYSGMLLLACISADRYIAIVQARRSFRNRLRTVVYSRVICVIIWVLALCLSTPTFVYYETYNQYQEYFDFNFNFTEISAKEDIFDSQKVCYFRFEGKEKAQLVKVLVPSLQVSVGFLLPLLVMGFCYASIIITLLHARNFQRYKAMSVVIAVVVVFVACHLPYNITLLYETVVLFEQRDCAEEDAIKMTLTITETLAYLHSCLNPVLYAFIGVKFRRHMCQILRDLWCFRKRNNYFRRVSGFNPKFNVSRRPREGSIGEAGLSFSI